MSATPPWESEAYKRAIDENKPVRQLGSFGGQACRQHTAHVVADNDYSFRSCFSIDRTIDVAAIPHDDDELSEQLQNLGRTVKGQSIGAPIARKIDGDESCLVPQRLRLEQMAPIHPAVGEPMNENH